MYYEKEKTNVFLELLETESRNDAETRLFIIRRETLEKIKQH